MRKYGECEIEFFARELAATHEILAEELARLARRDVMELACEEVELLARSLAAFVRALREKHAGLAARENAHEHGEDRVLVDLLHERGLAGAFELAGRCAA